MKDQYLYFRDTLIQYPDKIINIEKFYFDKIFSELIELYRFIEADFNETSAIEMYWKKYAPK